MNEIRLFSYKMSHDTGFAPNPFGGLLTLATCKPLIRKYKQIGDYIAGFTSRMLNQDPVGKERLIFLMKITNKISFHEYWNNQLYSNKIPDKKLQKSGDNIYRPLVDAPLSDNDFEQIENLYHDSRHVKKDLSGLYVLISDEFFYFGANPIEIPIEFRPTVPHGQSAYGSPTDDHQTRKFLKFINDNYKPGIHNSPHKWFSNNETWKNDENYTQS